MSKQDFKLEWKVQRDGLDRRRVGKEIELLDHSNRSE